MSYHAGQGVTLSIKVAVINGSDVKTSVIGFIRNVLSDDSGRTWLEVYGISSPIELNELVEVSTHG